MRISRCQSHDAGVLQGRIKIREAVVATARAELAAYTPISAGPPVSVIQRLRETSGERDSEEGMALLRDLTARVIESVEVTRLPKRGRRAGGAEERVRILWRDGSVTPDPDFDFLAALEEA